MLVVEDIVRGPLMSSGTAAPESWQGQKQLRLLSRAEQSGSSRGHVGSGGEGHGRKAGSVNPSTPARNKVKGKPWVQSQATRAWNPRGRAEQGKGHLALFTKSARRPSKEREEGAAKRSEGLMPPGIFSGMVSWIGWVELCLTMGSRELDVSRFGFSWKNEAETLSWAL